jgi:hypothetical protein
MPGAQLLQLGDGLCVCGQTNQMQRELVTSQRPVGAVVKLAALALVTLVCRSASPGLPAA